MRRLVLAGIGLAMVMAVACGRNQAEKEFEELMEGLPLTATAMAPTLALTPTPTLIGEGEATVTINGGTFTYKGGECRMSHDESWFMIEIGDLFGKDRFSLVVGRLEADGRVLAGERPVKGGGVFTGADFSGGFRRDGTMYSIGSWLDQPQQVTLDSDLRSGTFSVMVVSGDPPWPDWPHEDWKSVSGSFACK